MITQINNVPIAGGAFNVTTDHAADVFRVACRACPWTHWATTEVAMLTAATGHCARCRARLGSSQ